MKLSEILKDVPACEQVTRETTTDIAILESDIIASIVGMDQDYHLINFCLPKCDGTIQEILAEFKRIFPNVDTSDIKHYYISNNNIFSDDEYIYRNYVERKGVKKDV